MKKLLILACLLGQYSWAACENSILPSGEYDLLKIIQSDLGASPTKAVGMGMEAIVSHPRNRGIQIKWQDDNSGNAILDKGLIREFIAGIWEENGLCVLVNKSEDITYAVEVLENGDVQITNDDFPTWNENFIFRRKETN